MDTWICLKIGHVLIFNCVRFWRLEYSYVRASTLSSRAPAGRATNKNNFKQIKKNPWRTRIYIYIHTYIHTHTHIRRKFRSQTSDIMDTWKAETGRVIEEKRRRKRIKEETVRRKKIQVRKKVGKSRNTVIFQWFVAPEGRKVGSLKRRVRSNLARWETKNCTPLWREAHLQLKMYKTPQVRTAFGSWDVEKAHAVVARSTFPSQNVQSTPCSDHPWKLTCRKSARGCGAKHISKSKCTKHTMFRPPFVEKVHAVVPRSTCRSQHAKSTTCSDHFWTFRCHLAWHAQGIVHLVKSEQNVRVL